MSTLQPISRQIAQERLRACCTQLKLATRLVSLEEAGQETLAQTIVAPFDYPPYARATMDGYAVRLADIATATLQQPTTLPCQATTPQLQPGTTQYVCTGGLLPAGAESIVMQEDTQKEADGHVRFLGAALPEKNLLRQGSCLGINQLLFQKGTCLTATQLAVLASFGFQQVSVFVKPTVFLISTGDELCALGQTLPPAQVYDSNRFLLAALIQSFGGKVVGHALIPDDQAKLQAAIREATTKAQLVIITGGSSVGPHDHTCAAIQTLEPDQFLIKGLLIKPGKPCLVAQKGTTLIFGLPGHPLSAFFSTKVLVETAFNTLLQRTPVPFVTMAVLDAPIQVTPGRENYVLVRYSDDSQSRVTPIATISATITPLLQASGYIILAADQDSLEQGAKVRVYRYG